MEVVIRFSVMTSSDWVRALWVCSPVLLADFRRRRGGCGCHTLGFAGCVWWVGVDSIELTLGVGWRLTGRREQWCFLFFWVEVRLQICVGVDVLTPVISSPTFVVFPFCLAALFLYLVWFSFCFSISFEMGCITPQLSPVFN